MYFYHLLSSRKNLFFCIESTPAAVSTAIGEIQRVKIGRLWPSSEQNPSNNICFRSNNSYRYQIIGEVNELAPPGTPDNYRRNCRLRLQSFLRYVCFTKKLSQGLIRGYFPRFPTVLFTVVKPTISSLSILFRVTFLNIITSLTGSFYGTNWSGITRKSFTLPAGNIYCKSSCSKWGSVGYPQNLNNVHFWTQFVVLIGCKNKE